MGLLSDLAAVGFARFRATMEAHVRKSDPAPARLEAIGRGYVSFARTHPDLFLLMFRSERLDFTRPALQSAADAALDVLAGTVRGVAQLPAAENARQWVRDFALPFQISRLPTRCGSV